VARGPRRAQNNPIYLKSYIQVEDQLKFHYIVHCGLDSVEEKGAPRRPASTKSARRAPHGALGRRRRRRRRACRALAP
jgi:hypothetical protein